MLGFTSRSNCRFNVIVNPRNPWPTYNSSCLWIVPEKILDCASSGLFCGGSSGLSFVLFVTLFLAGCSRKNSWLFIFWFALFDDRRLYCCRCFRCWCVALLLLPSSLWVALLNGWLDCCRCCLRWLISLLIVNWSQEISGLFTSRLVLLDDRLTLFWLNLYILSWSSKVGLAISSIQTDLLEISDVLWAIYRCFCWSI